MFNRERVIEKSNATGRRIFHRVPAGTRFYAICFMRSMGNEDTMAASGWATGLKLLNASRGRSLHPVQDTLYGIDGNVCDSRYTTDRLRVNQHKVANRRACRD